MKIDAVKFKTSVNKTGALTFMEGIHDIPFEIKRVYYIYNITAGERRGFHAHKNLEQYLICVHGSCKILLDDGVERKTALLSAPNEGLRVGAGIWHEMYDFSDGAVLLARASDYYTEEDYIRNYQSFLDYVRNEEQR